MTTTKEEVATEVVGGLAKSNNRAGFIAGIALMSLSAGVALGYQICKRRLVPHYDAIVEREIADTKAFYSLLNKKDAGYTTPEAAVKSRHRQVEEAADAIETYQGLKVVDYRKASAEAREKKEVSWPEVEEEKTEVIVQNVFEESTAVRNESFDYEEEVRHRTDATPYVITDEEFLLNEPNYIQAVLTYYSGDDTLADERDQPVEDSQIEGTVGRHNLKRFGAGSNDKNIVYVRNEKTDLDFEVSLSEGKYAVEVLGYTEEEYSNGEVRRGGDDE